MKQPNDDGLFPSRRDERLPGEYKTRPYPKSNVRVDPRPDYQNNVLTSDHVTEVCMYGFVGEASELFLRGERPRLQIATNIGNGQPFVCIDVVKSPDGETISWEYRQTNGCCSLSIFND